MKTERPGGQGHTEQWEGEENGGWAFPRRRTEPRAGRGGGQKEGSKAALLGWGETRRGTGAMGKMYSGLPNISLLYQDGVTLNNVFTVTCRFRLLYNVINPSCVS